METEEDRLKVAEAEKEKGSTMLSRAGGVFKRAVIRLGKKIHGEPEGSTANLSRNHVIE